MEDIFIKSSTIKSQYRTPDISEFTEGFEYEIRVGNTWFKCVYNPNQSLKTRILKDLIRVRVC
jgi:hypothetical protein